MTIKGLSVNSTKIADHFLNLLYFILCRHLLCMSRLSQGMGISYIPRRNHACVVSAQRQLLAGEQCLPRTYVGPGDQVSRDLELDSSSPCLSHHFYSVCVLHDAKPTCLHA